MVMSAIQFFYRQSQQACGITGGTSMFLHDLMNYIDDDSDDMEIGVAVFSIESGDEIAVTYDIVAYISEYDELMIEIQI